MPLPVVVLARYGNVSIKQIGDQSMLVCMMFISMCIELTVEQVAVKSLLVYTSDEVPEAMAKKTKVSTSSMKVTFIRYTELTVCRGYFVSSKYV